MKENIHPKYNLTKVTCSCGHSFEVGSTKPDLKVEICSKCHPFYTGQRRNVLDATGRVEKFKKKYGMQ